MSLNEQYGKVFLALAQTGAANSNAIVQEVDIVWNCIPQPPNTVAIGRADICIVIAYGLRDPLEHWRFDLAKIFQM